MGEWKIIKNWNVTYRNRKSGERIVGAVHAETFLEAIRKAQESISGEPNVLWKIESVIEADPDCLTKGETQYGES